MLPIHNQHPSGSVELIVPLDYEFITTLGVILASTDASTKTLISAVTLNSCSENIDDSPTTFDSTFLLFPVNSPLHAKLTTIQATDGDVTYQPIFHYLDSVSDKLFDLDYGTRELFLTSCLTHGLTIEIECEFVTTQRNIPVIDCEPLLELSSFTVCFMNGIQETLLYLSSPTMILLSLRQT